MLSPQKKHQFFVSSTYTDLKQERDQVMKTILNLYQIPIGMEMFSAADEEQWEVIKNTINTCDYYILILADRYGSTDNSGVSFTEKEYDYARSIGIPIYTFIKTDNLPTTKEQRESDPEQIRKLQEFRNKVTLDKMVNSWSSVGELTTHLATAIMKAITSKPRPGWIRSSEGIEQSSVELAKLSSENRQLRDELASLKERLTNEMPAISVYFETDFSQLTYKTYRLRKFSKITHVPEEYKSKVSNEEIAAFNQEIEDRKEEIENFLKAYNQRSNEINNSVKLDLNIQNDGTTSGTDIFVEIVFPEALRIISEETLLKARNMPQLANEPANPLERAMRQSGPLASSAAISMFGTSAIFPRNNDRNPISSIVSRTFRSSINREKNTLSIELPKLTHTRRWSLDRTLFLVPQEKGKFEIVVSIICDQYKTKDERIIPIEIH